MGSVVHKVQLERLLLSDCITILTWAKRLSLECAGQELELG